MTTEINSQIIWQIVELAQEVSANPSRLDNLPYPDEFKAILRGGAIASKVHNESIQDLETEVQSLYGEVEDLGKVIQANDQEGQTAYLKLKGMLIGKMVDLKERTFNMRKMKQFQDVVLAAIDQYLTAEQRTEMMKRLEQ